MRKIRIVQAITFLCAFLLFQIELIIGKVLLPNFGGSYLVWGACVVFFQAALLGGYTYAHLVTQWMGMRRYRYIHLGLMLLPLAFFPGRPLPMNYTVHAVPMVLDVFGHLLWTIGPVFFVLSTMSILWQVWLSASDLPERANPYALFAVSNLGSFAALLSYPFYFEMMFDLHVQQHVWRAMYIFVVLLQAVGLWAVGVRETKVSGQAPAAPPPRGKIAQWMLYGAAGTIIFLSVTNIVTSEITPMPLLWVIPLALYLLSFVLNFKKNPFCPRWITTKFHFWAGYGVLFYFITKIRLLPIAIELGLLFVLTFSVCMFAQFKLAGLKPRDARYLGCYYSMMALGGFLGGVIVTWVVPLVSTTFIEYFLGFLAIAIALQLEQGSRRRVEGILLAVCVIALLCVCPMVLRRWGWTGAVLMMIPLTIVFHRTHRAYIALTAALTVFIFLIDVIEPIWTREPYVYQHRNYYGISRVADKNGMRYYVHGTTIHGAQYLDKARRPTPLTYFAVDSPVGEVLGSDLFDFKKIGVLGLGIGTMATYFNGGQDIDYFELEPEVKDMAWNYFSFLRESRGRIRYLFGDARLSLEEVPADTYDILIADAFSGDSIPVHLLTQEAIEIYRRRIKPDGVILFNVANRYIDHGFVLFATARSLNAKTCYKNGKPGGRAIYKSTWVAVTWDEKMFGRLTKELHWETPHSKFVDRIRIWTDEYSTLLPYIKYRMLWDGIKNFRF